MAFSDPLQNLRELGLEAGKDLADFGAGSGAYALPAAAVSAPGKVYAVEINRDLLNTLKSAAERAQINNIEYIWGDVEEPQGTKLADETVDYVIISNLLFLTDRAYQVALEAARILRSGGKALVIDWSGDGGLAPAGLRAIDSARAKEIFTQAGFIVIKEFPAGDHHFGLVLRKT